MKEPFVKAHGMVKPKPPETTEAPAPPKRRPGRPAGSKNKK